MKINNAGDVGAPAGSTPGSAVNGPAARRGAGVSAGTSVQIGDIARRLGNAETDRIEMMDDARIAEIKEAIAEGRFKVDAEAVADGLLAAVREMLRRDQP